MSDNRVSFRDDILEVAKGPIIAIQIPEMESYYFEEDKNKPKDEIVRQYGGRTISWELAAPLLDYPYYDGYGLMDCHDIVAWTETQVIYIHEYDGSTKVCSIQRNPQN